MPTANPPQLRLPREVLESFAALARVSDRLKDIRAAAADPSGQLSVGATVERIAEKTELPQPDAVRIVQALLNLHSLRTRLRLGPEELIASLTQAVTSAQPAWNDETQGKWKAAAKTLREVLDPKDYFATLQKATQLAYAHQALLQHARIISDLRPVFDEDGSDIKGMLLTNILTLEYSDSHESKTLHLALDATDIERLREMCSRALRKSECIRKAMANMPWSVTIAGEDDNG